METKGSLPCSQEPELRPRVIFLNVLRFKAKLCSPHVQTPCRLSMSAYAVQSQLLHIPRDHILHLQSEDAPRRVDKTLNEISRPTKRNVSSSPEHF
jgi:hypothetical protein